MNIKEFMPDYTYYNLVIAWLCNYPKEYKYSNAQFYHSGVDEFGMVTQLAEIKK